VIGRGKKARTVAHNSKGRPLPKKALRFLASVADTPAHFDEPDENPPFVPQDE
jgi:hypothetical protein